MKWEGAQRAGSRLAPEDDYYALLGVTRDATPEHIRKQVTNDNDTLVVRVLSGPGLREAGDYYALLGVTRDAAP